MSVTESQSNKLSLRPVALTASAKPGQQLIPQAEADLSIARAQLSAIKEYHSSLLETVYWALGTVTTIVALLAGFGWFANFRMYENDKTRLKEELETKIQAGLAQVETRLKSHKVELKPQSGASSTT